MNSNEFTNENRQVAMLQRSSMERMWENYRMEIMELTEVNQFEKSLKLVLFLIFCFIKEDKTEHSGK